MEAILYDKLEDSKVRCRVCNHFCVIDIGKRGFCGIRENQDGVLIALNYGKAIAVSIDPIEKKPLYEFLPRTMTYSFATVGCNLRCPWCQNHSISQVRNGQEISGYEISPEQHIEMAEKYACPSVSYTYSEPTIFIEYALDTMKLAKAKGIKNIWVSNGYMSKDTLMTILPYIDAFNIDYKGSEPVYREHCIGSAVDVLQNLRIIKKNNIHVEVTTLIIPGINDKPKDLSLIAEELINNLGKDFIWHLTRFHPSYKMNHLPITSKDIMYAALKIARDKGIRSVYLGNM